MQDVDDFCQKYGLEQYIQDFRKGALISQNPHKLQEIQELTEEDMHHLKREHTYAILLKTRISQDCLRDDLHQSLLYLYN